MGRTFRKNKFEASSAGCAVIISNRGGLPETITNGLILKMFNVKTLYKNIDYLIKNTRKRIEYQSKSIKNFYLTHNFVSKNIDAYRDEKFKYINLFNIKKSITKNITCNKF